MIRARRLLAVQPFAIAMIKITRTTAAPIAKHHHHRIKKGLRLSSRHAARNPHKMAKATIRKIVIIPERSLWLSDGTIHLLGSVHRTTALNYSDARPEFVSAR